MQAPAAAPIMAALLAVLVAVIVLLALAAALACLRRRTRASMIGCAVSSAVGCVAALAALLAGEPGAALSVPVGLPARLDAAGGGMTLVLDPLAAFFLLIVFLSATAGSVFALDRPGPSAPANLTRVLAWLPLTVAALALTVLAGDAFAMVLGVGMSALATWSAMLARPGAAAAGRRAGLAHGRLSLLGIAGLVPALALLAEHGMGPPDLSFAGMRAAPPDGWRGAAILLLVLIGAGSQAASVPRAARMVPAPLAALLTGATLNVALYIAIRLLIDIGGTAQPIWWGVPLLALGVGTAVSGARRAVAQGDVKASIVAGATAQGGFLAVGIGTALVARGADLPALATLALAGTLLHAFNQGIVQTLLTLCAGTIARGAGTQALSRLGGLIHRMPITAGCVLVGGAGMAAVPAFAGFAGTWLLFQSVIAAPRIGGVVLQTGFAVVAVALAMAVALAAAAAVRLVGIAFLGRPRTPRAAVAEDAMRFERAAMLGLAALAIASGLLPGPVLWLLDPALRGLTGLGMETRVGWLAIAPGHETPGYAALPIILLLALFAGLAAWATRRYAAAGRSQGATWTDGFAAPPAWLPFGDPTTQYTGASFADPVLGLSARPAEAERLRHLTDPARRRLAAVLALGRTWLARRDARAAMRGDRRALTATAFVLVLFLAATVMFNFR